MALLKPKDSPVAHKAEIGDALGMIETRGLMSVESIGEALGAGTNCGSCRPEIAALLNNLLTREAAE